MSAFVPSPGLSLKSSDTFVNGASHDSTTRLSNASKSSQSTKSTTVMMANDKKGGLPFGIDKLISRITPGAKKNDAAAPPKPKAVAPKTPAKTSDFTIRIDDNMRAQSAARIANQVTKEQFTGDDMQKAKMAIRASYNVINPDAKKLPKFYNSLTSEYEFQANAKGQNATMYDCRVVSEASTNTSPSNNTRQNKNGTFRNMDPYTDDLYWARPGWSVEDANTMINVAMRQIFGNANLFESDMQDLAYSISCIKQTANMKEFVRALGLSSAYRKRYFESTSNLRFIEMNFKHFLGRAPRTQEEISEHIQIINELGYNAEINSYVDSDEYDSLYGNSRIPAVNFQGGHPHNADMNLLAILNGGYATSDAISKTAYLPGVDASRYPAFSVVKGLPEAWRGENNARSAAGFISSFGDSPWNTTPKNIVSDELQWKSKFGSWQTYWYKDTPMYKNIMKPVLTHSAEEEAEAAAILKYGTNMASKYTAKN